MYCSKCGKEVRSGDAFCSACGSKVGSGNTPKKKNNGLLILIGIVVLVLAAGNLFGGKSSTNTYTPVQSPSAVTSVQSGTNTLPAEPNDGDVLENSDYADGTPRRRVSGDTEIYITDYRPDGTQLRDTILYYNNEIYGGKRVTNCDAHGNPTDETETMADGTLWLYLFYTNTYDEQGRPLQLTTYNRMGYPLHVYTYTYNSDGSYRMDWDEYRGPVYEYDYEYTPDGTTTHFSAGYTTYTANGDVIDQMIYE